MGRVDGVVQASVDWRTGRVRVRHQVGLDLAALVRAVDEASGGTRHHYRATVVAAR